MLNDRVLPALMETKQRVEMYAVSAKFISGLKIESEEFGDISNLYKSLGDTIEKAKSAKPVAPMSATGMLITKIPISDIEVPEGPKNLEEGDDANEIVNMIAQSQEQGSDASPNQ